MKYLLIILIISTLCSCNTNDKNNIIDKAELHLKEQLKDPSSLQVIKSEITDTTMMSQYLKYQYEKDTLDIERIKIENDLSLMQQGFEKGDEAEKAKYENILNDKLAIYKATASRHLKALNDLKQDSIYSITIYFEYRAKNGFGALDKYKKDIYYYPSDKSFK